MKANGADHNGYRVNSNVTFVPCYAAKSDITEPTRIYLSCYEDWAEYAPEDEDDLMLYFPDEPIFVPEGAFAGKVKWTSSDESILSFDSPAVGTLKRTGDVTLTATAWNGMSADLLLHVYGPEDEGMQEVDPESMEVDPSEYTIEAGESIQVLPKYQPKGKHLKRMSTEYVSDNESVVKVLDNAGVLCGLEPGKANITVTSSDIDETISLNATFQVTVKEAGEPFDISRSKVVLSKTAFTYNGKAHKPVIRSIGGKKLTEGKDYSLKWSSNSPKKVGKYTLTITGQGDYTGTAKASFKINPKGTKITSLKKASGSVTVKWKKQSAKMSASRITGYQIQLATNKKFTRNLKTLSVKGYKKVSKRVTGLKKGKSYYVHVRTYKTIKGKRYYSPWSKAWR